MAFQEGDKVFYTQNGPNDTGVIEDVHDGVQAPYLVRWDKKIYSSDPEVDWFTEYQLTRVVLDEEGNALPTMPEIHHTPITETEE